MKATWDSEFSAEYEPAKQILDLLSLPGVEDWSWHNDACPKLAYDLNRGDSELRVFLWFDHPNRNQREMPSNKRYMVCVGDDTGDTTEHFITDDERAAVRKFLEWITEGEFLNCDDERFIRAYERAFKAGVRWDRRDALVICYRELKRPV